MLSVVIVMVRLSHTSATHMPFQLHGQCSFLSPCLQLTVVVHRFPLR